MDYRQLFEKSPVPVLVLDTETWQPLEFNNAASEYMGYSRAEFSNLTITDFEFVPKPGETREHINEIRRKGQDEFTCIHRSKEGRARSVHISISMVSWLGREAMLTIWHEAPDALTEPAAPRIVTGVKASATEGDAPEIVACSHAMKQLLARTQRLGASDMAVLIEGETGTGKELIARRLHRVSTRSDGPFVPVNCGALPRDIADGELFGVERGAFTGADRSRPGYFESAHGGTIFLDEIGEMDPALQVRLLRVLQEGEIRRLGSTRPTPVDVRVLAATNRDLLAAVDEGTFRADLYYRLAGACLHVPPLRERPQDIEHLVAHFAGHFALEQPVRFSDTDMRTLAQHPWPGNVRELQNIVRGAVVLAENGQACIEWGPARPASISLPSPGLADAMREHIALTLIECRWVIEGPSGAARRLGLQPSTLRSQIKRLGLARP